MQHMTSSWLIPTMVFASAIILCCLLPLQASSLQRAWQTLRSIFTPRPVRPVQLEEPSQAQEPTPASQEASQETAATPEQALTPVVASQPKTEQQRSQEEQPAVVVTAADMPAAAEAASTQECAAAAEESESRAGVAVLEREEPAEATSRLEAQVVKEISKVSQGMESVFQVQHEGVSRQAIRKICHTGHQGWPCARKEWQTLLAQIGINAGLYMHACTGCPCSSCIHLRHSFQSSWPCVLMASA